MKNKILFGFVSFFIGISSAFGASLDHFEVELSPKNAKVGEALDLTVKAVDKNNSVVTDYTGSVLIFSRTDPEASVPIILSESTYKFKESDQGVVKFENGIKFTKSGKHDINVFDLDSENIFGVDEVNISESGNTGTSEIEFISPENGLTIGDNHVKVSGSTVKNHKVRIVLNGTTNIETTSNSNGIFEQDVDNLLNGENTFKAQVLDADNNVIGETSEIKIKIESDVPSIKSIKLIPEEVYTEGPYDVELLSSTGLKEVTVVVNDSLIILKEDSNGLYKGNSYAPKEPGTYKVDANLVNELGKKLNVLGVASLKVNELNAPLTEEKKKTEPEPKKEEPKKERDPLKITGLKLVELKTKSILSWDELEKAESYNVYKKNAKGELDLVATVKEAKIEILIDGEKVKYEDFYVKANGKDEEGEYEGILSDPTKVKTGPEFLIILIVSLFFAGLYLAVKGRKNT